MDRAGISQSSEKKSADLLIFILGDGFPANAIFDL
jgi:hypothetical protein